ncbi:MAG: hypothetical protein JJ920_13980 [Roseitalea sp.]|jgi:Ca2+-binding EF-hand superfamily protein|nr:hypothetical protein [Roseitalea sp.]MBO6722788.1 hypothetical protein [Roseitalea sp.]MBO6744018.1 hypothetical protein [Roseitalea sp.]
MSGLALLLFSAVVPAAAEQENTMGRDVAVVSFNAIDEDGKGYVHMGDMEKFRQGVFEGMDYDNDGRVDFAEFSAWDIGFEEAAVDEGKPEAIVTARRILFAMWDRNGDGKLTQSEHRFALSMDFRRADINGDSVLDEDEYLIGYSVNLVMRAAIRPDIDVSAQ